MTDSNDSMLLIGCSLFMFGLSLIVDGAYLGTLSSILGGWLIYIA